MIRKAGMSITKNEPCTINSYTARCLFSYHSIANIVSYFSASGVAAASSSVLSAVSSSAFAESPSVSGVSVTSVCSSARRCLGCLSLCRICCRCLSYIRVRCRSWSLDRKAVIICDLDLLDQFFSSLISAFFFHPSVVSL